MSKLFKYFSYLLFIPFWWIQLLIPRNRNIWVFGAWFGERYADNSRALFDYISKAEPKVNAVWLSRNNEVVKSLQLSGSRAYLCNSIQGVIYSLKAKYAIVSNGKRDINSFCINGAVSVNLWHGVPMKKINCDSQEHRLTRLQKILFKYLFPFKYEFNYSHYLSTSEIFNEIICSAFDTEISKVICAGYPRNDVMLSDIKEPFVENFKKMYPGCKIVAYLPTHRGDHLGNVDYFTKYGFKQREFNKFLSDNNLIFIYKGHFYIDYSSRINSKEDEFKRIVQITDSDILSFNVFLKNVDILITDYSGAYFDFLLTNKPILFFAFDLEHYINENRGLYFNYFKDIVCGPLANNWPQVIDGIKQILTLDEYQQIRKKKSNLYNGYTDYNNSKNIFELLYSI